MKSYKWPFLISPADYPKNESWVINRWLYLFKLNNENPQLDNAREFWRERDWIQRCCTSQYNDAWMRLFDQLDTRVSERAERMPYMEVIKC